MIAQPVASRQVWCKFLIKLNLNNYFLGLRLQIKQTDFSCPVVCYFMFLIKLAIDNELGI